MVEMLEAFTPCLGSDHPKHLLGIGDVESICTALPMGFDSFGRSVPMIRHSTTQFNLLGRCSRFMLPNPLGKTRLSRRSRTRWIIQRVEDGSAKGSLYILYLSLRVLTCVHH